MRTGAGRAVVIGSPYRRRMSEAEAPRYGIETAAAVRDLLDLMRSFEERFSAGDPALVDEQSVLEAYRWIFTIVDVGMQAHLWADTQRPHFVDIVGRYKKWGGDNSDAFYQYAPIDPTKTYRVRARRADAVYYSLTIYGGPNDGRYSERIVGSVSDRDIEDGPEGDIEIVLSPDEHPQPWIKLDPDAVCAITRDYLIEPDTSRRMEWSIECLDGDDEPLLSDEGLARKFRAVRTWIEDQAKITPLALGEPNIVDEPYPCRPRPSAGPRATRRTRWARTSSPTTRRWCCGAGHPSARSGTSACGTRSCTSTTRTTTG